MQNNIQVDKDYINRRIDKYLRDKFGLLQSQICVLAKNKKLLVNSEPVEFNYRLSKNDKINVLTEINFNSKNNDTSNKKTKSNKQDLPQEMIFKLKKNIIFEDENVLVINKPYGLSVQGGTGVKHSLEDYFSILSDEKLRIVHRIDKDTSGILLLAKNVETAVKLTEMFKKREVHKKYLAILNGIPLKKSGTIKTYIFQSKETNIAYNARTTEERMNGKQAISRYNVIRTNDKLKLSLVEFFPLTGRKHQIRLHAQHIKCPIVGDEKYGFEKKKAKLQLFAVALDATPIVKVELNEKDFPTMINI
jgi:23S rRNA pseudouridine955/2504/2580 synthase